jgi:hypothetical protein
MAMKKKPQGKFAAGKVEAPRKVTINGETHYLVYVTPEEAKGLKKAGGSGQAGPKGIPAFPRGSVSKDKVDKATGAKSSDKSTGGSNKSGGPTGGRGSEKSTPAPRDRDDRQPTPAPKSTPAPAPRDRDDRQPAPAPKSTPKPAPKERNDRQPVVRPDPAPPASNPLTRFILAPGITDGPSAAEKAAAAAKVKALADSKAEAEAKAVADSKAKAAADKAKADAEDLAMAQAVLPKVGPNPNMTTIKDAADARAKELADKAIRDQIESDRAAQLARDQKLLSEKNADRLAALDVNPVYARLETITDETQTAPVFTPNILDAQTDDDLGLTSSPLAGTAAPAAPVVTNTVVAPPVTNTKVATGNYQPTVDPKTGEVTDRLGNPVVTNAKGYGYFDPITGLAVTPWTDSINGGGPGYGGAAFGSGGGGALDTNKDNYISEAEIAAGKAKGLALEQNAISKIGTGLGVTPLGSGIDPTGIAGFADPSFIRKLGAPAYVRPDSSIAPGQELNKWWEADKNALGFAYSTQDEISQRRADAVRAAAAAVPKRDSDRNDNGPVAPTVPTVTTPPTYTENASSPFAPIPNPNYNPADPMSLAYLTNPSYEELLAYRNSGTTPARPFAKGGIANLVKDGGNEKTIISDAIRAVEGKMSERDSAISLAKFVKAHGEPALRDLVDKVSSGEYADTRERFANGENGMVRGPGNGSGTDDKVPATIDGEQDVLLADGEMVLRKKTTDAIEKAYPGLLDRINAAEGDAPKVLAKALDFIEGRNRRG